MRDLGAIIPLLGKEQGFREWNAGGTHAIDWESYQHIMARVEPAIFWSEVFAPHFVEVTGMVLRLDKPPDDLYEWMRSGNYGSLSATQIEALTSHIYVKDLFPHDPVRRNPNGDEYDLEVYLYIAERMAQAWRGQLKLLFPDKNVEVHIAGQDGDPQVYAVTVRDDETR